MSPLVHRQTPFTGTRQGRRPFFRYFTLVLLFLLAPTASARDLVLGVLAYRPEPEMERRWRPLAEYLSSTLPGQGMELRVLNRADLEQALERAELDFVFTNPSHFIALRRQNNLSGVLATLVELEQGQPTSVLGGVIFTTKEHPDIATLEDLRGRRVAFTGIPYLGSFQIQAYELAGAGITLPDEVYPVVTGAPHDLVVDAVLAGQAEVGFIRTGVIERMAAEGKLDLERIRVVNQRQAPGFPFLLSTRLYPEWPVLALRHVDAGVARRVAAALLAIEADDPVARASRIHGFTIPADYTQVEDLARKLRLPPFESPPLFDLEDVWNRYRGWLMALAAAGGAILLLLGRLALTRRRLEAQTGALGRSEARLRTLLRTIPDLVWLKDTQGVYLACNPRFERFCGKSEAEILGRSDEELCPAEAAALFRAKDQEAMSRGAPHRSEEEVVFADDGHRELQEITKSPVYDTDGRLLGVLGIGHDITRSKQSELALRRSEERYRSLIAAVAEGVILMDRMGSVIACNVAAERILGLSQEQMIGLHPQDPLWQAIREDGAPLPGEEGPALRTLRSGEPERGVVMGVYQPSGELRWISVNAQPMFHEGEATPYAVVVSFTDISELKQGEQTLRAAKELAEAANRAKSAFLANMSHELRTPLNAVLGFAQVLLQERELPELQRRQVERIQQGGNYLLSLINDILDLAKIEAGRYEVFPSNWETAPYFRELVDLFRLRAEGKNLWFHTEVAPTLPPALYGDARRLRQVLLNLLGNAVKFTEQGGVTLRADYREGRLRLEVEDTGVGIPPQEIDHIFEPFRQVGEDRYKVQGTGLGLSITRALVVAMEGELTVESAPGEGTRFRIAIPLEVVSVRSEAEATQTQGVATGYRRLAGEGPIRVLVVDDVPANREVLRRLLEPLGFLVMEAVDGQQCLEMAQIRHADLVLMDLRMPEMDGIEATRALRQTEEYRHTPIVVLSASAFADDRERSAAAGCNLHLAKPVRLEELLDGLQRLLPIALERADPEGDGGGHGGQTLRPEQAEEFRKLVRLGDFSGLTQFVEQLKSEGNCPLLADHIDRLVGAFNVAELIRIASSYAENGD